MTQPSRCEFDYIFSIKSTQRSMQLKTTLCVALGLLAGLLGGTNTASAQDEAVVDATPPPAVDPTLAAAPDATPPEETMAEPEVKAEDIAAQTFLRKCMGCHTIGGGALTGPDLKPASGWPRKDLAAAIVRMEKNVGPIPETEVELLTDFISAPDAVERLAYEREQAALRHAAQLEPASAATGRQLFLGSMPLTNGGIACGACHQAGGRGGTLATSLEDAFTRIGETPLISTCENPGYPVMRAIYTPVPVTKQEAMHLVKYLEEVAVDPREASAIPLHMIGFLGAAALFFGAGWAHKSKAQGTRARLVAQPRRRDRADAA